MADATTLDLAAGEWRLALRPAHGGAIARLDHRGAAVLRPMPDDAADPLAAACFPLVPYANRIAHGRFTANGRSHVLPLNFGDHPHSLHGLGWISRWEVESLAADRAVLVHRHGGEPGWPWSYRAEQRFVLGEAGLKAELILSNTASEPMPSGLGFHPYFVAGPETRLQFVAQGLWHCDATMLPTHRDRADRLGDWANGAPVAGTFLIDNAYEGWDGTARIVPGEGPAYRLAASGADWLHLYRPPDASFFCAEPVSHGPDAINRGGMAMLAPGKTQRLTMRIGLD